MRRYSKYLFVILMFNFAFFLRQAYSSQKDSLIRLESQIENLSQDISNLNINISDVSESIYNKNEKYVSFLGIERRISSKLIAVEKKVIQHQKSLLLLEESFRKGYLSLLVLEESEVNVESFLLIKKKKKRIESEMKLYDRLSLSLKKLKTSYLNIKSDLEEISSERRSVHTIILDLETKKNLLVDSHQKRLARQKVSSHAIEIIKKKIHKQKIARESREGKFHLPLRTVMDLSKKSKGVDLFYEKDDDLLAPNTGKVIYLNELSSYGKVLIIKHDNDLRSVVLGDLSFLVKSGDLVEAGQVIGRAHSRDRKLSKLYLEMRKGEENINLSQFFNFSSKL